MAVGSIVPLARTPIVTAHSHQVVAQNFNRAFVPTLPVPPYHTYSTAWGSYPYGGYHYGYRYGGYGGYSNLYPYGYPYGYPYSYASTVW